jgi:cytochrome P450
MASIQPGAGTVPATRRLSDVPGPPGLPLIGNLLQIDTPRLHQILEEWSRQYGECFRFRITNRRFLVISNPQTIATVLRDRPDGFQRSTRFSMTAREMLFDGVLAANGERWRRQRPMVMASFDPGHTKSFFPALVRVTARFTRRWQRFAAEGQAIDLQSDLMRYTVDVTAGLAFGADINTIESEGEVIQRHLDKIFPAFFKRAMSAVQYWHYFKLPADRELDRHLAALGEAIAGFIIQARTRMDGNPTLRQRPSNLIEAMIAARDAEGSGLDDGDVAGNVMTMLLAGEDTTANTLAWMTYLLHRHRDVMQRAAEEVQEVIGSQPLAQEYEQLGALRFLEACANETLRLRPVVPINTTQAVRDTVLEGIHVPAGTLVICLMRPSAVDERHFPNARSFDPQRWLSDSAQGATSTKRVAMPFGAGPRLCPGRYLAMVEIKMVMSMLLSSFDIEEVTTADGREPQERLALTMAPVGLRLKLRSRPRSHADPAAAS